jgi:hypothetical protein
MKVRILKPAKTAMQSGTGNTHEWVLVSEPGPKQIDPLMGWTSSRDMMQQVRLTFVTVDEAKAYAEKRGWQYTVEETNVRPVRPKAYADNFAYTRVGRWTH